MSELTEDPFSNLVWGDDPQRPTLTLDCRGERRKLDILKSLRDDPLNIRHELIIQTIYRYTMGVSRRALRDRGLSAKEADKCLNRILETLMDSARKHGEYNLPFEEYQERNFERQFFRWLARVMQSKRGRGLPHLQGGKAAIESRLNELHDEDGESTWGMDFSRVAAFLAHAELPGRITAESLHNAYLAHDENPASRKSGGAVRQATSKLSRRVRKIEASEAAQQYLDPWYSGRLFDSPNPDPMDGLAYTVVRRASASHQ